MILNSLYHYTSNDAAESIVSNGTIQASTDGWNGPGRHCHRQSHHVCTTQNLLDNNYGMGSGRDPSYIDRYIRMDADGLSASRVEGVSS